MAGALLRHLLQDRIARGELELRALDLSDAFLGLIFSSSTPLANGELSVWWHTVLSEKCYDSSHATDNKRDRNAASVWRTLH